MPRLTPFRVVCLSALASAIAMTLMAAEGWKLITFLPAAAFAAVVIFHAVASNARHWKAAGFTSIAPGLRARTMAEIAQLSGVVFAWGAATLFAIYLGTDVRWQHGWQYASLMALLAAAHFGYAREVVRNGSRLATASALNATAQLASLQGLAILGALIWLIVSGKLGTPKGDWAANHVFLAGGFAIAMLNFVGSKTDRALAREPQAI